MQFALSQCSFDHDMSALAFTEVWALASELALSVCDAFIWNSRCAFAPLASPRVILWINKQLQTTLDKSLGVGSPDE